MLHTLYRVTHIKNILIILEHLRDPGGAPSYFHNLNIFYLARVRPNE